MVSTDVANALAEAGYEVVGYGWSDLALWSWAEAAGYTWDQLSGFPVPTGTNPGFGAGGFGEGQFGA